MNYFIYLVRHETSRAGLEAIHRGCRRDIERAPIPIAPGKIGGLLRRQNRAEMTPVRIPDPDSLWPGHIEIPRLIHLHPVRNSLALLTRFLAKHAPVGNRAVSEKIVYADVPFLAVVHVKLLSIG